MITTIKTLIAAHAAESRIDPERCRAIEYGGTG